MLLNGIAGDLSNLELMPFGLVGMLYQNKLPEGTDVVCILENQALCKVPSKLENANLLYNNFCHDF